jgi:hypothetical protein
MPHAGHTPALCLECVQRTSWHAALATTACSPQAVHSATLQSTFQQTAQRSHLHPAYTVAPLEVKSLITSFATPLLPPVFNWGHDRKGGGVVQVVDSKANADICTHMAMYLAGSRVPTNATPNSPHPQPEAMASVRKLNPQSLACTIITAALSSSDRVSCPPTPPTPLTCDDCHLASKVNVPWGAAGSHVQPTEGTYVNS